MTFTVAQNQQQPHPRQQQQFHQRSFHNQQRQRFRSDQTPATQNDHRRTNTGPRHCVSSTPLKKETLDTLHFNHRVVQQPHPRVEQKQPSVDQPHKTQIIQMHSSQPNRPSFNHKNVPFKFTFMHGIRAQLNDSAILSLLKQYATLPPDKKNMADADQYAVIQALLTEKYLTCAATCNGCIADIYIASTTKGRLINAKTLNIPTPLPLSLSLKNNNIVLIPQRKMYK